MNRRTNSIFYKTNEEIELIRQSSLMVGKTHAEVAKIMRPGVKTIELDRLAETFIRDHGGVPSFKNYKVGNDSFPFTLCMSINEAVVHGMPSNYELKPGDVVSIDCGVFMNGFHGDSAYTYGIGEIDEHTKMLLIATKEALYKGIEQAVEGRRVGDIGFAIQQHAEKKYGYGIVRELVGHGVGRSLHELPEVPNFGRRGRGTKLKEGMVIAIEPMINQGRKEVERLDDGWTIVTSDRKMSAHYEHTVAVRKKNADILSTFEYIEEVVRNNADLVDFS